MPTRIALAWRDPAESHAPVPSCDICTKPLPGLGLICSLEDMSQVAFVENEALRTDGPWFLCHPCRKIMDIAVGARWVKLENIRRCWYLSAMKFAEELGNLEAAKCIFLIPTSWAPDFNMGQMFDVMPGAQADFKGNIIVHTDELVAFLGLPVTRENSAMAFSFIADTFGKPFSQRRGRKRNGRKS